MPIDPLMSHSAGASAEDRFLKQSDVFCMAPWIEVAILPKGGVYPCCTSFESNQPIGNLRENSLKDIWNSPSVGQMRRNMLEGKKSPQCVRCYEMDLCGLPSDRKDRNREFARHFSRVAQTAADGSLEGFRIPFLDLRTSNICNFRCRYCNPDWSSAWRADYDTLWKRSDEPITEFSMSDLRQEIDALLPQVEKIYFAGGEPLLQTEHYQVLRRLIELKRKDVYLLYSTNFSFPAFRDEDVMQLWNEFENVQICASLDAAGNRGEYIRKGQRWDDVVRNRERMKTVCPKVRVGLTPTVSMMNALSLPDLHRDWLEKQYIGPEDISLILLFEPKEYCVQVLPAVLKKKVAAKYQTHAEYLQKKYGEQAARAVESFKSAVDFMFARDQSNLLEDFRKRTRDLDRIRGESFADTFPEMRELTI